MHSIRNGYQIAIAAIVTLLFSVCSFGYTHTVLHPITWQGEKWEYLVEHPTGKNHIDPALFEEILDTAGQHGWELVEVTSEYHFYTFYFKRPLLPHKIESHRLRLAHNKKTRAASEGNTRYAIQTAVNAENTKRAQTEANNQNQTTSDTPAQTQKENQSIFSKLKSSITQK